MATLYVDAATGDDDTIKANNSEQTPWATIGRAAWGNASYASPDTDEAAAAGDTVLVAAGTYTEGGPTNVDNSNVALNPANSGTSGNPITFRGVGNVYVRLNTNVRGAMIGANNRSYIIWDNFIINDFYGGSLSDRGPVGLHAEAANCQIINCEIFGHTGTYNNGQTTFEGNYRLISLEDANNNTIKNNLIYQARAADGTDGGQNEAGIMLYDSDNNIFEHNEIHDCGCGIFVKGAHEPETQSGNVIRYNYLYDCLHGIRVLTGDDANVYQNIVVNGKDISDAAGLYAGFGTALRSQWVNNTVYNCKRAVVLQASAKWQANTAYEVNQVVAHGFGHEYICTTGGTSAGSGGPTGTGTGIADGTVVWDYTRSDIEDVQFYNNLFVGCDHSVYNWASGAYTDLEVSFTRNFYYNNTAHFTGEGIGTINFATWQGTHSEDVDGSSGTDPQFVNAAGGDFKLASNGQTSLTAGRVVESIGGTNGDTIPVGAYITGSEEIGIESAAQASDTLALFLA